MKKLLFFSYFISSLAGLGFSQEHNKATTPKLVIGIVVDQMRYDYLENFGPYFSENGFKKLQKKGFCYSNLNYNYKPTYTGPGHASIFTGTTPSSHGIVGNNWYSHEEGKSVYCVKVPIDSGFTLSPNRMLSEGIADVIKSTNGAKAYGVALKDRGAILPAGYSADGAYWFSSESGKWESSSFYNQQSPKYLNQFNKRDFKSEALAKNWTLHNALIGEEINWLENSEPVKLQNFEHNLDSSFIEHKWNLIKAIPYGNQLTVDFAMDLIKEEELGLDSILDFLSVSFSATDYVGHIYGVESPETVDTYLQLDKSLAKFIEFLDQQVGEDNYVLFLSSDHGADFSREYLIKHEVLSGRLNVTEMKHGLDSALDYNFGEEDWIVSMQNLNVYFKKDLKLKYKSKLEAIFDVSVSYLSSFDGIDAIIITSDSIQGNKVNNDVLMNGYLKERSGDLILQEAKHWTSYSDQGSTHGSLYDYDTHVPFLIYGAGVSNGTSAKSYSIVDIAPSICNLIGIEAPSSSNGIIITEHKK